MILTGAPIGEALALDRPDLVSEGLRIDESALNGQASYEEQEKPDGPRFRDHYVPSWKSGSQPTVIG